MAELLKGKKDYTSDLLMFTQKLVRIPSFSGQEGEAARAIAEKMKALDYDEILIDSYGNVLGRMGSGERSILFESHMDVVQVHDTEQWQLPPFSAEIKDGFLWGRGSADMKAGLTASVYAPVIARERGWLDGKTVYVTCCIFEEDCDGEGLDHLLKETGIEPDFAVICEPSGNQISTGHNGKAQIIVKTQGVSAHGSAPEKGVNAVYEMAEIIQRVEQTNLDLKEINGRKGTLVLSRISSTSVSLNAVPSECEIYLDRRMVMGETEDLVKAEMEAIIEGKDAAWEIDTVKRISWTGQPVTYRPLHIAWQIDPGHHLTQSLIQACADVYGETPRDLIYWDFSTDAVALIKRDVPCIGFGPGDSKLAHMRDERCAVDQITEACAVYAGLIEHI